MVFHFFYEEDLMNEGPAQVRDFINSKRFALRDAVRKRLQDRASTLEEIYIELNKILLSDKYCFTYETTWLQRRANNEIIRIKISGFHRALQDIDKKIIDCDLLIDNSIRK